MVAAPSGKAVVAGREVVIFDAAVVFGIGPGKVPVELVNEEFMDTDGIEASLELWLVLETGGKPVEAVGTDGTFSEDKTLGVVVTTGPS